MELAEDLGAAGALKDWDKANRKSAVLEAEEASIPRLGVDVGKQPLSRIKVLNDEARRLFSKCID